MRKATRATGRDRAVRWWRGSGAREAGAGRPESSRDGQMPRGSTGQRVAQGAPQAWKPPPLEVGPVTAHQSPRRLSGWERRPEEWTAPREGRPVRDAFRSCPNPDSPPLHDQRSRKSREPGSLAPPPPVQLVSASWRHTSVYTHRMHTASLTTPHPSSWTCSVPTDFIGSSPPPGRASLENSVRFCAL